MAVTLEFERTAGDPVMGIDEAGRGPLVGGVYAGAVSVPLALAEKLLEGEWSAINDSKKLSEKKRFALAEVIKSTPGCIWAVASASPQEIDKLNILNATHLAMRRAAGRLGSFRVALGTLELTLSDSNSTLKDPSLPAALLIARWVALRIFSLSISAGLALATAQIQPGVDLMTSASAKRFFSESFFESLIALHSFASSFSASASGTDTAPA